MTQIANGEAGSSVRSKINALLPQTALASGAILSTLLVSVHAADGSRTDTMTMGQLITYLAGQIGSSGGGTTTNNVKIIGLGDSIMAAGAAAIVTLGYGSNYTIDNRASVAGETMFNLEARLETSPLQGGFGQFFDPTKVCLGILGRGINDLRQNLTLTGAALYAEAQALVLKGQRAGLRMSVNTIMPTSNEEIAANPAIETHRHDYNTLLRGDKAGAEYLIDLDADATLGLQSNHPGAGNSLFIDGLHPQASTDATYIKPLYKQVTDLLPGLSLRLPTEQTITLDRSIFNGTAATGQVNGATFGSHIAVGVTGLTVNTNVWPVTFAWDGTGAAGTVTAAFVETIDGLSKTSPLTVQAGSSANYLVLPAGTGNFSGTMTSTAHTGGGFDYTGSGGTDNTTTGGNPIAAWQFASKTLPANTTGWMQCIWPSALLTDFSFLMGWALATENAASMNPNKFQLGASMHPAYGNKYDILVVGNYGQAPDTTVAPAAGDPVRVFRNMSTDLSTATGVVQVYKSGSWQTVFTLTGMSTAALKPVYGSLWYGTNGAILQPQASASVA